MKNNVPLWFKAVYVVLIIGAFYFFLPKGIKEKVLTNKNTVDIKEVAYNAVPRDLINAKAIDTFTGQLTGYGPDCTGCRGITSTGYNVKNGNIYFYDNTFGEIRIVAADKSFAFGTVVRITAPNIYDNPIIAIVLDRGGAIKGQKFDLLFESEKDTKFVGHQKNVKYEVLRYGW